MKGGKGDEDKDLSAEFSRRLEDEEEVRERGKEGGSGRGGKRIDCY